MKYVSSITALAVFCMLLVTGCNDDNDNNNDNDRRTAIRLSSNVQLGDLRLQDNQIVEGQDLSLFVTRSGNVESVLYSNEQIIANGSGGFNYDETLYYPTDGSNVDFYAVHPYSAGASLGSPISFSILANQAVATNYLNSDLLYATNEDVERTTAPVSLRFTHKMAKLDFVIIQGDGADISGLNQITTFNVRPTTSIDPALGTLGNTTGTPIDVIAYGILPEYQTGVEEISGVTAIIAPQSLSGRVFRIRLGNIDYFYTTNPDTQPNGITFEAGKEYRLELTINQASIDLVSSISNWLDGGTITGDGTID